ncbi:hypothetical protein TWF694_009393 [Orbilia ellipsospora]|uniref:Uncharacterized protein n=1 Tax=Orbilia ellipsospora TaxID=2528407 RepID=A0AAV9XBJ4_9PEZI
MTTRTPPPRPLKATRYNPAPGLKQSRERKSEQILDQSHIRTHSDKASPNLHLERSSDGEGNEKEGPTSCEGISSPIARYHQDITSIFVRSTGAPSPSTAPASKSSSINANSDETDQDGSYLCGAPAPKEGHLTVSLFESDDDSGNTSRAGHHNEPIERVQRLIRQKKNKIKGLELEILDLEKICELAMRRK